MLVHDSNHPIRAREGASAIRCLCSSIPSISNCLYSGNFSLRLGAGPSKATEVSARRGQWLRFPLELVVAVSLILFIEDKVTFAYGCPRTLNI